MEKWAQAEKCDIFISYASVDFVRVRKIVASLDELGYKCWMAPESIPAGVPYARAIMNGIEESDKFLVILTENSVKSDNVINEVENAHNLHKHIIPVFLSSISLPGELSFYLRRLHWATIDENRIGNLTSILGLPPKNKNNGTINQPIEIDEKEEIDDMIVEPLKGRNESNMSGNTIANNLPEDTIKSDAECYQNIGRKLDVEGQLENDDVLKVEDNFMKINSRYNGNNKQNVNWYSRISSLKSGILSRFLVIMVVLAVLAFGAVLTMKFYKLRTIYNANELIADSATNKNDSVEVIDLNSLSNYTLVDLGVSVLWASQNLDAENVGSNGNYYAWSVLKSSIKDKNYANVLQTIDDISGNSMYDVSTIENRYDKPVRMPTSAEFEELIHTCEWKWVKSNSKPCVYGYLVTGKNNKSIFLPASGRRCGETYEERLPASKVSGNYWSSNPKSKWNAKLLYFTNNEVALAPLPKYYGLSIRPVADK